MPRTAGKMPALPFPTSTESAAWLNQLAVKACDIFLVKPKPSRRSEPKGNFPGGSFLNCKVNRSILRFKTKAKAEFPEAAIHLINPVFELLEVEPADVAGQNGMKELTDGLMLVRGGVFGLHREAS